MSSMISMEHMRCAFQPKGVAVVGATDRVGSVGRTVIENLLHGYEHMGPNPFEVFLVNPKRDTLFDLKCYPSVSAIDSPNCEQVIVITPAASCVDIMRDCAKNKAVKLVVVVSAGFKEVGPDGLARELELVKVASEAGIAVVGPNCLGIQNSTWQLNGTFASDSVLPGPIAFIAQSGAMCTTILDWSMKVGFGFSAFIAIGSMSHVDYSQCIEYLGQDEATKAILIYVESIGNASNFMRAARKVSPQKPIVVIKAGKTPAAARAALKHTGSIAGSCDAFNAAMERSGCLVVDNMLQIQNIGMVTALQPPPTGDGLIVVTNAGGPGVLCGDAATFAGLRLVNISDDMVAKMDTYLPAAWSRQNPIDILGDAKPDIYARCVEDVFDYGPPGCALIVALAPQSMTKPTETARAISEVVSRKRKEGKAFNGQVVCSFMGGHTVQAGRDLLMKNGIPSFAYPDTACEVLGLLWKQVARAQALETIPIQTKPEAKLRALEIIANAMRQGKRKLNCLESAAVVKAYGLDVLECNLCKNIEETVEAAKKLGYPCVLKVESEYIDHRGEAGAIKMNLKDEASVRAAYNEIKANVDRLGPEYFQGMVVQPMFDESGVELLVGSSTDTQFGPLIIFGAGGDIGEVFEDVAMAVPPMGDSESARLIESTKISKALKSGARYSGCPMDKLKQTLNDFSIAVCDLYVEVFSCEINPLMALKDRIVALDVRVTLRYNEPTTLTPSTPCLL